MHLLRPVDKFLNGITMYRLVMWGLAIVAAYSCAASFLGFVGYNWIALATSLFALLIACFVSNLVLSRVFKAPTNVESSWITGLILFFTLAPAQDLNGFLLLALAAAVAMASKYVVAWKKHHIFNPAAFALFALSVGGSGIALWWVGTPAMLPAVLLLGLLVVRKIRRFDAFLSFVVAAIAVGILFGLAQGFGALDTLKTLFLSWPLMFMGTIMLTEPFTMPPSRPLRVVYGAIVGALFSMQFHFGPVYSTPELALLLGNIYAFIVGSRQRLMLTLSEVVPLSPGVYEFVFRTSEKPRFKAGQYLEWTLPHQKPDLRGNRRYLTISSSPDSGDIRFGTRMSDRPSTFKQALMKLKPGDTLTAAALGGDFTLPKEETRPLVFIAGGIGITPFASMLRHMLKEEESRDITLIYAANSENDFAYRELIENAKAKAGLKPVYLAGARITEETITQNVADMASAMFYISGPDIMVRIYREMLARLGAHRSHIKSDYFPGL